jgi:hypothetical protein
MSEDNRDELSRLIGQELEESRRGPSDVVRGWSLSARRTFYGWKDGSSSPQQKSRGMLEDALGWRRGVVTEILEAPITQKFTLSEVRDWAALPDPGLVKARDLSDAELLAELTRRLGNLRAQVDEMVTPSNVVPLHGEQNHFGLAASDEHVPGEDDRD